MRGGGATDILGGPTKVKPTYIFVCKICILFFKYGFNAIKEPGHAKVLHTTNRHEESHGIGFTLFNIHIAQRLHNWKKLI